MESLSLAVSRHESDAKFSQSRANSGIHPSSASQGISPIHPQWSCKDSCLRLDFHQGVDTRPCAGGAYILVQCNFSIASIQLSINLPFSKKSSNRNYTCQLVINKLNKINNLGFILKISVSTSSIH